MRWRPAGSARTGLIWALQEGQQAGSVSSTSRPASALSVTWPGSGAGSSRSSPGHRLHAFMTGNGCGCAIRHRALSSTPTRRVSAGPTHRPGGLAHPRFRPQRYDLPIACLSPLPGPMQDVQLGHGPRNASCLAPRLPASRASGLAPTSRYRPGVVRPFTGTGPRALTGPSLRPVQRRCVNSNLRASSSCSMRGPPGSPSCPMAE